MRRSSFPFLVVATVLALLLPLEQAHCLWMGTGSNAGRPAAKMAADHSCCRGHAAAHGRAPAPECPCLQLPEAALAHALVIAAPQPVPAALAALVPTPLRMAPAAWNAGPAPAPDVGGPPLPAAPRALSSRAPPACA